MSQRVIARRCRWMETNTALPRQQRDYINDWRCHTSHREGSAERIGPSVVVDIVLVYAVAVAYVVLWAVVVIFVVTMGGADGETGGW